MKGSLVLDICFDEACTLFDLILNTVRWFPVTVYGFVTTEALGLEELCDLTKGFRVYDSFLISGFLSNLGVGILDLVVLKTGRFGLGTVLYCLVTCGFSGIS